nr:MAG: hypothetical protein [Wufeng shrew rhabdovirus 10]
MASSDKSVKGQGSQQKSADISVENLTARKSELFGENAEEWNVPDFSHHEASSQRMLNETQTLTRTIAQFEMNPEDSSSDQEQCMVFPGKDLINEYIESLQMPCKRELIMALNPVWLIAAQSRNEREMASNMAHIVTTTAKVVAEGSDLAPLMSFREDTKAQLSGLEAKMGMVEKAIEHLSGQFAEIQAALSKPTPKFSNKSEEYLARLTTVRMGTDRIPFELKDARHLLNIIPEELDVFQALMQLEPKDRGAYVKSLVKLYSK